MVHNLSTLAAALLGCLCGVAITANRVEWLLPLLMLMVPWPKVLDNAAVFAIEWQSFRARHQEQPDREPALTMLHIKTGGR